MLEVKVASRIGSGDDRSAPTAGSDSCRSRAEVADQSGNGGLARSFHHRDAVAGAAGLPASTQRPHWVLRIHSALLAVDGGVSNPSDEPIGRVQQRIVVAPVECRQAFGTKR